MMNSEPSELRCRHCGGETFAVWYPVSERQGIDILGQHEGVVRYEYDGDTTTGECGPEDEYTCRECGALSPSLEYLVGLADQEEPRIEQLSDREKVKRYAGLIFNVGTIIEDRRDGSYVGAAQADDPLWAYLWENVDSLYEQIGPVIDRVETDIFGKEKS